MYQSQEEIYEAIEDVAEKEFTERADIIMKHTRDCLWFSICDSQEESIPLGASRIGGDPDLPEDFTWPTTVDGQPLAFLFQINTSPLEPGMIAVFAGKEIAMDAIPHHVEFIADNTPLVRTPQPDDLSKPSFFEVDQELTRSFFDVPLLVESHQALDIPRWSSNAYFDVIGEDDEWGECYEELEFEGNEPDNIVIRYRGNHVSYSGGDAGEDACQHYGLADTEAPHWVNLVTLLSNPKCCIWDAGLFQIVEHQGSNETGRTHAAVQSS